MGEKRLENFGEAKAKEWDGVVRKRNEEAVSSFGVMIEIGIELKPDTEENRQSTADLFLKMATERKSKGGDLIPMHIRAMNADFEIFVRDAWVGVVKSEMLKVFSEPPLAKNLPESHEAIMVQTFYGPRRKRYHLFQRYKTHPDHIEWIGGPYCSTDSGTYQIDEKEAA